jgi:hypothetical protein
MLRVSHEPFDLVLVELGTRGPEAPAGLLNGFAPSSRTRCAVSVVARRGTPKRQWAIRVCPLGGDRGTRSDPSACWGIACGGRHTPDLKWSHRPSDARCLHDLRHFYASGLIAAGCAVVTVQRALGHAKATTTLGPTVTSGRPPRTRPDGPPRPSPRKPSPLTAASAGQEGSIRRLTWAFTR